LASLVEDAVSDRFIREHYAGLAALLQRRIGDPNIAAELLNEAVAMAIEHTRQGRVAQPELLAGYVYRVALNLYRNYRREFDNRADLRVATDQIQHLPSDAIDADAPEARVVREVREIVLSLPTARDREIVKRFYLDEEDKDDICQSLGLSPLHFDKVLFRARQRLRSLLEQRGFSKTDFFSVLFMVLCVR
jgi:RNA polymerase sigma-70 factor (ECF subfamily)